MCPYITDTRTIQYYTIHNVTYTAYYILCISIYQHSILDTTVHVKRGNTCQTSSMIESRLLRFGLSEAEAEMEFGVQAFTGISSHAGQEEEEREAETQCKPRKASGDPGVLQ